MEADGEAEWFAQFPIQPIVDLDFIIGQEIGWPIGTVRQSSPEYRRRILAAAVSYVMQLSSVDYAKKRYVAADQYELEPTLLRDATSDLLKRHLRDLADGLRNLHAAAPSFGQFGAELTLFKFPTTLDLARMLSNRGLFLEVLPILRLCLEMVSWAAVAFFTESEAKVTQLAAQKCIPKLKPIYPTCGRIYGYLSQFSHWEYAIHTTFIGFEPERPGLIKASPQYRAMSLALCLVIFDVFLEVVRYIYDERSRELIVGVQGVWGLIKSRTIRQMVERIVNIAGSAELMTIKLLLA